MRKGDFQPNGFDLKALRKDAAKIRTEFFTTSQRPNAEDLQNAYFLHLRDSARHLQSCSTAFSSRRWATQARRMTSRGPHPNSEANVANISPNKSWDWLSNISSVWNCFRSFSPGLIVRVPTSVHLSRHTKTFCIQTPQNFSGWKKLVPIIPPSVALAWDRSSFDQRDNTNHEILLQSAILGRPTWSYVSNWYGRCHGPQHIRFGGTKVQ